MSEFDSWIVAVCRELGLDATDATSVGADTVLDVARDVAHGVARPAAPLTTFLVGRAVGAGMPLSDAAARVTALAEGWQPGES